MKFDTITASEVEILASDNFNSVPIKVAAPVSGTVVKAGTPLTLAGAAALDGSNAYGILLYDVDTAVDPNGAVVVQGIVDWRKCVANSGATASASTMHSSIPAIEFRTNIGYIVPPEIADTVTMTNSSGVVTITAYTGTAPLYWLESGAIPSLGDSIGDAWTEAALNETMTGVTTNDTVTFVQLDANGLVASAEIIPVPAA